MLNYIEIEQKDPPMKIRILDPDSICVSLQQAFNTLDVATLVASWYSQRGFYVTLPKQIDKHAFSIVINKPLQIDAVVKKAGHLVTVGNYSDYKDLGFFTEKSKAEEFIKKQNAYDKECYEKLSEDYIDEQYSIRDIVIDPDSALDWNYCIHNL